MFGRFFIHIRTIIMCARGGRGVKRGSQTLSLCYSVIYMSIYDCKFATRRFLTRASLKFLTLVL
jgi:hypothetical protein